MIDFSTDSIHIVVDADRIATLTIDVPGQAANTMSAGFKAELGQVVPRLRAAREQLAGVVITSAKKTFFAGGDLRTLLAIQPGEAQSFYDGLESFKATLRGLEQLGIPVACAINGAALGGGWEICLCTHARFCLSDDKLLLGLPEASLGLLPGAGGVTRMVRHLGLARALPLLVGGKNFTPSQALAWKLLDGTADNMPAVIEMARQWVLAHPEPRVRWDEADFVVPDLELDLASIAMHAPADLLAHGHGRYPARQAVLAAAVEGAVVDVDTALRLETRYLTSLAIGRVAKNMINTFFFQNGQIKSGKSRPVDAERVAERGLRIDGRSPAALAMALASASRRVPAVLRVGTPEAKHETEQALDAAVRRIVSGGAMAKARAEAAHKDVKVVVAQGDADAGVDLGLVESVEGLPQAAVLLMGDDASRTSELPPGWIGIRATPDMLGAAVVEVVRGAAADAIRATRVYDFLQQIGKTPIVVSDAPRGFLQRVGRAAGKEGLALCREGLSPAFVENASLQTDMACGALAMAERYGLGKPASVSAEAESEAPAAERIREVQDRILFIQALEAIKCLDEGVVQSPRDANIASVQGIGFPTWTGGVIQYVNQYGLARFVGRASEFAARCGDRFAPPNFLQQLVAEGVRAIER